MPKVPLEAAKGFTYMTRRLTAGDQFEARNPLEARILKDVRKVAVDPAPKAAKNKIISGDSVYVADKDLPSAEQDKVPEEAPKPAAKKAPAKRKAAAKK